MYGCHNNSEIADRSQITAASGADKLQTNPLIKVLWDVKTSGKLKGSRATTLLPLLI